MSRQMPHFLQFYLKINKEVSQNLFVIRRFNHYTRLEKSNYILFNMMLMKLQRV
jgi:hypothetical protein